MNVAVVILITMIIFLLISGHPIQRSLIRRRSAALARESQKVLRGFCSHRGALRVESAVDGELVAWLCPSCDSQLDPGWEPPPRSSINFHFLAFDYGGWFNEHGEARGRQRPF